MIARPRVETKGDACDGETMVTFDTIQKLRVGFETSSWAIWSEDYPEDGCAEDRVWKGTNSEAIYDMIIENIEELNPSVILMGVNPSGTLPGPYSNFHSPDLQHNNDVYLKRAIHDGDLTELKGAYMTDLLKDEHGAEAHSTPEMKESDVTKLEDELTILGAESDDIICFGKSKFKPALSSWFNDSPREIGRVTPSIYKYDAEVGSYSVDFYAAYHYIRTHHRDMTKQLEFLNEYIA